MSKNPILFLQVEENYGSTRLMGRVGYVADDGHVINVQWRDRFGDDRCTPELDGFTIRAYVGSAFGMTPLDAERGLWGWGFEYDLSGAIDDPKQALAIARILTKVKAGMDKANGEQGYLAAGDFTGFVLRIAKVLRIKDVHVRNVRERLWNTGELYRRVDGAALQYWVADVDERARANRQLIHSH